MADGQETTQTADKTQPAGDAKEAAQRSRPIEVDETQAVSSYSNFCRVTGTPEELIVDFGLNTQPLGEMQGAVKINQRIVMNFFTAKRLISALHASIQRHEAVFGVLETDIQKRVRTRGEQ